MTERPPEPLAITGLGLTSAAGAGIDAFVDALRAGRCALGSLPDGVARGLPMRTGGRIPSDVLADELDPRDRAREACRAALAEALAMAAPVCDRDRIGLALGTGIGAVGSGCEPRRRAPSAAAGPDAAASRGRAGEIAPHALTCGLARGFELGGPRSTFAATCVSASYALEEARAALADGRADAMVLGGVDLLERFIQAGFCKLGAFEAILSDDGFVLGEAAAFLVLERARDARARGATVLGLLVGHALSCDSSHLISPDDRGLGMTRAVVGALGEAGLAAGDVALVSVSAIASPKYERMYVHGLRRVFGEHSVERVHWEASIGHVLAASSVLGVAHACLRHAGRLGPAPGGAVLALTVGFGGQNGAALVAPASARAAGPRATEGESAARARLAGVGISRGAAPDLERGLGDRWDSRRALHPSVRGLIDALARALEAAGWWTPGQAGPLDAGLVIGADFASLAGYRRFARALDDGEPPHAPDFLFGLPSTAAAVAGLAFGFERYQATVPAEGAAGFTAVGHAIDAIRSRRLERVVVAAHTLVEPDAIPHLRAEGVDAAEPFELAVAWCLEADADSRGPWLERAPARGPDGVATAGVLDDVPPVWRELAAPALLGATRRFDEASEPGARCVVRHRDSCFDETALIRLQRPS